MKHPVTLLLLIIPLATLAAYSDEELSTRASDGAVSADPTPINFESDITPGTLYQERLNLFKSIKAAKARGIGIGSYLSAFASLEDQARRGESESTLKARIQSLNSSLDEQMKRSKILKTQRPSLNAQPEATPPANGPTATNAGIPGSKLDQLKQRLDSGQIPPGLEQFLNSDKGKKILQRLETK